MTEKQKELFKLLTIALSIVCVSLRLLGLDRFEKTAR